jgi:hypothetical protein
VTSEAMDVEHQVSHTHDALNTVKKKIGHG